MEVHNHMEGDIENQKRALTGVRASTSFTELGQETSEEVRKEHNDPGTEVDLESQTAGERRHGYLRDSEIRPLSHPASHPGESAKVTPCLSGLDIPTPNVQQLGDSREETAEASKSARKERSSWDFEADDSFKFESGGTAVPEPEKPADNRPPIFAPSFIRNQNDIRAKLMHLSEGTFPPSLSGPEPEVEAPGGSMLADGSEQLQQEVSFQETVAGDAPVLSARKKPPRPLTRSKTRLQDPPTIVPAVVADQLASLRSEMVSNSGRVSRLDDEGQSSSLGSGSSGRRVSVAVPSGEGELQRLTSRKSVLLNVNESAANPVVEKPPEKVGSRLGIFSPSVIFSGSRLRLLSRSKASIQQPPAPSPPQEEADPLDDDSIPRYKKRYRSKQSRWFTWIQWISLCILVVVLVLAIKLNKLQMVIWKDIQLWQWLALATVIISGRLITGWLVMVLWCLFTTACLWMVKILAVKVAANTFHRAAYFDRVQDCLFHQYVLETLSAPRGTPGTNQESADHAPQKPTQARQELEALLQPDVLDPDSSSDVKPQEEPPPLPSQVESKIFPETVRLPTPGKSHLNAVLDQSSEMDHASQISSGISRSNLGRGSSATSTSRVMASPSPVVSAAASNSRMTLRSSNSRLTLVSQEAPLSTGSRLRRVTGADDQITSSVTMRSTSPIQQEKLQELTAETVSAWTMKRLMKIIRKTNIATFSSILDQEAGEKIDSEAQAKAAAKQIFYNIARPGEKSLTLTDFLYFLPEDQATRAFALFEVNDLGQITKKALMKWVVNIYKERRALALTLSDNRTVVAKLHRVLDVLLIVVAITICFLIMGVNTQKLIVGFSSVLLPSVFVFGNAARSTFESLIFLFVMHPFDVGDRICVDGSAMIVEIHASTPVEQLGLLKERITKYIESLPQFWYPVFRIVCKDIEDSTRMKMALWVQHHLNFQESGERWQRRSNMILHMKAQLEDLGIGFHLPRQEITVTGIPVLDVPMNRPSQATPM
ncbi:hypothetical protein R1flu_018350 [Riccia fluitans]|uniref:Mechanosensitive ion channel protein n=1 Tax=Riccia fluitans TaxID=41844 RepID=A0ABD1ZFK0_9MARC